MAYDWVKIVHIVLAMGWVTGAFVAPRGLIYVRREVEAGVSLGPAYQLTMRTYRFALMTGGIAACLGLLMAYWLGWPGWTGWKILVVLVLLAHYAWTGVMLRRVRLGQVIPSDGKLRAWNEMSVLIVGAIVAIVVFQP